MIYTLEITNEKCPRCGKPGFVNGVLCLDCAIAENDRRWKAEDKARRRKSRKNSKRKPEQRNLW